MPELVTELIEEVGIHGALRSEPGKAVLRRGVVSVFWPGLHFREVGPVPPVAFLSRPREEQSCVAREPSSGPLSTRVLESGHCPRMHPVRLKRVRIDLFAYPVGSRLYGRPLIRGMGQASVSRAMCT